MIDPELLDLLACPIHRAPVALAADGLVADVNARIETGRLRDRSGRVVRARVDDVLVCEEAGCLFAVEHDIPSLLAEEVLLLDTPGSGN